MTPAPISVERLRELLAKARVLPWETGEGDPESILCAADYACVAQTNKAFTDAADNANLIVAAVNALPALLHQLAELERELHDAEHEVTIMERNLIAAERAREEAMGLLRDCDTVANVRGMLGVPDCIDNNGQPYQSAHLAAFLAASGGKVDA